MVGDRCNITRVTNWWNSWITQVVVIPSNNANDYSIVNVNTTGNAIDFGNLTVLKAEDWKMHVAVKNSWIFGWKTSPPNYNIIDFVTIASQGDAD